MSFKVGSLVCNRNEVIGSGEFGTSVFKGTFKKDQVAVKRILRYGFVTVDGRILNCNLNGTLKHPNIAQYFAFEKDLDFEYLAMELCDISLAKYVRHNKDITLLDKMSLAIQTSEGVAYLHLNGYLHKDLKPSNVLLNIHSEGEICVKLTDIGLVKGLEDSASQLSSKLDYSAMAWIAPELYVKPSDFTAASDVWSLGCVIFYSFTGGKHPFDSPEGKSLADRATNIIKKKTHLTPLQQNGHLNANLQTLISSVIADRRTDRPQAAAVVAELKYIQECASKRQNEFPAEDLLKHNKPSKIIGVGVK